MTVNRLALENFRNINHAVFTPSPDINIITGANAQGKTNLLEAIWLFRGAKSFRGAKDTELISHDGDQARLCMTFLSHGYEQTAEIKISSSRENIIGGLPVTRNAEMSETFCAVVFSPAHLSLVKDGPEKRRKLIDTAITQIRPRYTAALNQYHRAIMGRNAILKDIRFHSELFDLLDAWEEKIANAGAYIINQRSKYIHTVNEFAPKAYEGLSHGKETFYATYDEKERTADEIAAALKAARTVDMQTGITSVGPHRDDIELLINGKSARTYGSQGQQRSAVIAMKLAEAAILKRAIAEPPVTLLDDVLSELDDTRQRYIINHIGDGQVFITCCDLKQVEKPGIGKVFLMEKGALDECFSTSDETRL